MAHREPPDVRRAPPLATPALPVRPVPLAQPASPSDPPAAQPPLARPLDGNHRPVPVPIDAGAARAPLQPLPATGRPIPTETQEAAPWAIRTEPEDDEHAEVDVEAVVRKAPPWLISGIFHMLVLIVLGLWMFTAKTTPQITLVTTISEDPGQQLEDDSLDVPIENVPLEEPVITAPDLPVVEDPFAAPPKVDVSFDFRDAMRNVDAPAIGLALTGREKGMKQALLAAYGGTQATEAAVLEGLRWLVRNQRRDGSWSLKGPYADGAMDENPIAATAMALLAFQGAGHTHQNGKDDEFSRVVAQGWDYLLKQQDKDGNFFKSGTAHHRLYSQAQVTIALCELYGMTSDQKLKEPAQRAVDYAVKIQDSEGGWRYYPGSGSDTSVTGWFVMALQSARMAYLPVPDDVFKRIGAFLDSVSSQDGRRYGYQSSARPLLSLTAEGLLCRQYLGWQRNDPRLTEGVGYLTQNLIDWTDRNAYYWYYATQACHHMEGDVWKTWNDRMRKVLPETQTKTGSERGSWHPVGDQWGPHGGRLYVTCLHIYMLEVYYRHLPIYQHQVFLSR